MRIIEDTCGRHDTIGGCCSAWSNFARYGLKDSSRLPCQLRR